MAKQKKTNAMRMLDATNIEYRTIEYNTDATDGMAVAEKVGKDPDTVFKTLVATDCHKEYLVFVIPVTTELDLKAAAKAAEVKKVEMLPLKELLPVTGYIKGGCSPIGMKKVFRTFIDEQAEIVDAITCSGGRVGAQIELSLDDFLDITKAEIVSLTDL